MDIDKKLPYPTRLVTFPNGDVEEEFIIPEDDKEYVLKQVYPFDPVPDLDERMIDIHAGKEFVVRQFRVFWEHGMNWLTSPYYLESGGTVIDWMDIRDDESDDDYEYEDEFGYEIGYEIGDEIGDEIEDEIDADDIDVDEESDPW